MGTINLQVNIESDEMLETLEKIQSKAQDLEMLIRHFEAMSGRLKGEESTASLPTAHKVGSDEQD